MTTNSHRRGMVRPAFIALTLAILALWVAGWVETFRAWDTQAPRLGVDFRLYLDAASRWAAGGAFYPGRQLAGPYEILGIGEILYPPTSLLLFLPFTVLPTLLWWVIPIGVVAAVIGYWRPAPFGWPLLALILWWPRTNQDLLTGNPAIWVAAAAALGTIWAWPSVFVVLKPSLAPAALIGVCSRAWWLGFVVLIAVSLPFLTMWSDYARVLIDARHPQGLLYSFSELPMVLVGVAAWAASPRHRAKRCLKRACSSETPA